MTNSIPQVSSRLSLSQAQELLNSHRVDALYIYDRTILQTQIDSLVDTCKKNNIHPRYAMKANHNPDIMHMITDSGIDIDASSTQEAVYAIGLGIDPSRIQITSQQRDGELTINCIHQGVRFIACSLYQLEQYCIAFPNTNVGVRINPGIGSGAFAKVNTGGITSSFGIWHEYIDQVNLITQKYNVKITTLHTHIGSGSNPLLWQEAARMSCSLLGKFTHVNTLNLGGGIKVPRMLSDKPTDINAILTGMYDVINQQLPGHTLRVEIEPGTFLVANCGGILCRVGDIVDTGIDGHKFLKLTTGMDAILRPAMYGASHHIVILGKDSNIPTCEYVVVGHCCESSDLFTPDYNNEDQVGTRVLPVCTIGDIVLIEGCGAYCESMSAKGYNGFSGLESEWIG